MDCFEGGRFCSGEKPVFVPEIELQFFRECGARGGRRPFWLGAGLNFLE
jgi:hypothetical protein